MRIMYQLYKLNEKNKEEQNNKEKKGDESDSVKSVKKAAPFCFLLLILLSLFRLVVIIFFQAGQGRYNPGLAYEAETGRWDVPNFGKILQNDGEDHVEYGEKKNPSCQK